MLKRVLLSAALAAVAIAGAATPARATTGHWTPNASSIERRANATSAVLSDGRVVVPGGVGDAGALATAEVYNPSTDTWTALPPMHQERWFPRAATLPNDRVLVVGLGDFQFAGRGTWEIYDAAANSWSQPKSFTTNSYDGGLFPLDASHIAYLDSTDSAIYDATTDAWTPLAVPWSPAQGFALGQTLADGRILALSGRGANTNAYFLSAAGDSWQATTAPSLPASGPLQSAQLSTGRVLLVTTIFHGGDHPWSTSGFMFDPVAQTWTDIAVPEADLYAARLSATPSGNAVLAGGDKWTSNEGGGYYGSYEKRTYRFDAASETWATEPDMQTGRQYPSLVMTTTGVLAFAGDSPRNEPASSQVYVEAAPPPVASIADAQRKEGGPGRTDMNFRITLSSPAPSDLTLRLDTAAGTAASPKDYVAGPVFVTIPKGSTTGVATVRIQGDQVVEPNETFTVSLSGFGITLGDGSAVGKIVDDDIGSCVTPRPGQTTCVGVQDPLSL